MPMMIRPKRAMKASLRRQIESAMKYRGYTTKQLAEELSAPERVVREWIRGDCTVSRLWDIAEVMHVTFYVEFLHL